MGNKQSNVLTNVPKIEQLNINVEDIDLQTKPQKSLNFSEESYDKNILGPDLLMRGLRMNDSDEQGGTLLGTRRSVPQLGETYDISKNDPIQKEIDSDYTLIACDKCTAGMSNNTISHECKCNECGENISKEMYYWRLSKISHVTIDWRIYTKPCVSESESELESELEDEYKDGYMVVIKKINFDYCNKCFLKYCIKRDRYANMYPIYHGYTYYRKNESEFNPLILSYGTYVDGDTI